MKLNLNGAAAAVALVCGASSASAAIVDVTYIGTVNYGQDDTGVFGAVGGVRDGDAFTVRIRFDSGSGPSSPTYNYVNGGSGAGNESPVLSASVTINGRTVFLDTSYYSEVLSRNDGSVGSQYNLVNHPAPSGLGDYDHDSLQIYVTASTPRLPAALTGPVYYWIKPGDDWLLSTLQIDEREGGVSESAYVSFIPTRVSVFTVVPETSTWAMMLGGFAGLGLAGWRVGRPKRRIAGS